MCQPSVIGTFVRGRICTKLASKMEDVFLALFEGS